MTSSVDGRIYGSGSGTRQGGCILELSDRHGGDEDPWLAAGDEVTPAVERLGEIRATIPAQERGPWPARRSVPSSAHAVTGRAEWPVTAGPCRSDAGPRVWICRA
jgi:hypothetical protein